MTGLPLLPGNSFRDVSKANHYKRHIFDQTSSGLNIVRERALPAGPMISIPPPPSSLRGVNPATTLYQPATPNHGTTTKSWQTGASTTVLPTFVAMDRMVLRFFGFFKEAVHESRLENFRVRKVVLLYYLDDNTIQINEPQQENSGINQGGKLAFLRRHAIPKGGGQFVSSTDLKLGTEVTFYGRSFRIVDCDAFTAAFFDDNSMELGTPEEYPYNPYDDEYMIRKAHDKRTRGSSSVKTNDLTHWSEAMLGRPTHLINEDKLAQFLDYDRKVLRWFCRDESLNPGLYGDVQKFVIHYHLSDDTVEINEVRSHNSGRDNWSRLLSRQRLPLDYLKPGRKEFYSAADMEIGAVINVFGRPLLVCDCDSFTQTFMAENFGKLKGEPIVHEDAGVEVPRRPLPEWGGYGSEEDSLGSFYKLIPQKPKENWLTFLKNDKKTLRFLAQMDTNAPEDASRAFIVSYMLASDRFNIYEPPVRNSGVMGGKWMEPCAVKMPGSQEFYKSYDLQVGAVLEFRKHRFKLIEADEYTLGYMERNRYPGSDLGKIVDKLKKKFAQSSSGVRQAFLRLDVDNSGGLEADEFGEVCRQLGFGLTPQEVISVMRAFDPDGDGSVKYEELLEAVIGEDYHRVPGLGLAC